MKIQGIEFEVKDIKDLLKEVPFIKDLKKRNKKEKIGVIIGITTEEKDERNRVDNDLIEEVNSFLNNNNLIELFNIIKLDEQESKNINNQNWLKVLEKYNSHLIIYGHVAKRNERTGYSLKLEAGVMHRPIPMAISNILSSEFASIFPRQRFIPASRDLLGFEVTAKEIALAVQYMVGVALFVSGFLGLSLYILNSLKKKIDGIESEEIASYDDLKEKTEKRIFNICVATCSLLYDSFSISRNLEFIKESKKYIDLINKMNKSEKRIKNVEAIYYFLIENNVDKAIAILKSFDNSIKPYNLAFLYFFKGDVENGLRYYDRAFKREIDGRDLIELEYFITEILEKFSEKYQLIFAQALINFKGKKDYQLASKDFSNFIGKVKHKKTYEKLLKLAIAYKFESDKKK